MEPNKCRKVAFGNTELKIQTNVTSPRISQFRLNTFTFSNLGRITLKFKDTILLNC